MQPTNKQKGVRYFASGNDMLKKGEFFYEYATGGKIGWTEDAGYTIVTAASKDGVNLLSAVVLEEFQQERPLYRYPDIVRLWLCQLQADHHSRLFL